MKKPDIEFDSSHSDFQEEWLSAYLDEELTIAQREIVEQRLDADPSAQELLDDLKRVRNLVVKLPAWPPGGKVLNVVDLENATLEELEDCPVLSDAHAIAVDGPLSLEAETIEPSLRDAEPAERLPDDRLSRGYLPWWKPLSIAAGMFAIVGIAFSLWRTQFSADSLADARRATPAFRAPEAGQTDLALPNDALSDEQAAELGGMRPPTPSSEAVSASLSEEAVSVPAVESRLAGSPMPMVNLPERETRGDSPRDLAREAEKLDQGFNPGTGDASLSFGLAPPSAAAEADSMPAATAGRDPAESDKESVFAGNRRNEALPQQGTAYDASRPLLIARSQAWSDRDFELAMASVESSLRGDLSGATATQNSRQQQKRPKLVGGGFPLAIASVQAAGQPAKTLADQLEPSPTLDWFYAPQAAHKFGDEGPTLNFKNRTDLHSESATGEPQLDRLQRGRDEQQRQQAPAEIEQARQEMPPPATAADGISPNAAVVIGEQVLGRLQDGQWPDAGNLVLFLTRAQAEQMLNKTTTLGITTNSPLWITLASPDTDAGKPDEKVILILRIE